MTEIITTFSYLPTWQMSIYEDVLVKGHTYYKQKYILNWWYTPFFTLASIFGNSLRTCIYVPLPLRRAYISGTPSAASLSSSLASDSSVAKRRKNTFEDL